MSTSLKRTCKIALIAVSILVYMMAAGFLIRKSAGLGMMFYRVEVISIPFAFYMLRLIWGKERFWDFVFKRRLVIALTLLVITVASNFNYSSVGMWDIYIQPGSGNGYVKPVLGWSRSIRSDEWLVNLPRHISGEYNHYAKDNDIVRATKTDNLSASGLYLDYSALCKPAEWGYYLFGSERGEAFAWNFRYIFGFLCLFELLYILTEKNKKIALVGAVFIICSSFFMWWSTVEWVWSGSGAIVAFYYLLVSPTKRKPLWGIATAILLADFVVILYPAWQVTSGYVFLALFLYLVIRERKAFKELRIVDWAIILLAFLFFVSIVGRYLYNYLDYIKAIMNTKYPGQRVEYGGYVLEKLYGGIFTVLLPFIEHPNASEASNFITFFPLPYILAIIAIIKNKNKNVGLLYALLIPALFLNWYCWRPLPEWLAKITLMTYSTPKRAVDVFGFTCLLLLIFSISKLQGEKKLNYISAFMLSALAVEFDYFCAASKGVDLTRKAYVVIYILAFIFIFTCLVRIKRDVLENLCVPFLVIVFIGGISVNPINHGLNAIKSKPLYAEVRSIVNKEPDAKWLAGNSLTSGDYLICAGARTYNSTNYIPNIPLWKKLGFTGRDEEIYNRYSHFVVNLSDDKTEAEVPQADVVVLNLAYEDLDKLDVDYILMPKPYEKKKLTLIYADNGAYIYRVKHKK